MSSTPTEKGKPAKIPRPMNAFMIFAREYRPKVKKEHPTEENHVISIRLGKLWAALGEVEKDHYQELSREAVNEHRRKYPDYRYEPKPKIKKKRRYDQYLLMDRLRTAAADAAREQKEEEEAARNIKISASAATPSPAAATYTSSRSPWGTHPSLPSHLPATGLPQNYYYPQAPNITPAHSQPTKPAYLTGHYNQGAPLPYQYTGPYTPVVSPGDLGQPLDMTVCSNIRPTSEGTGKVYCELTTPSQRRTGDVPAHCIYNWPSQAATGYHSHWSDGYRLEAASRSPTEEPGRTMSYMGPAMYSERPASTSHTSAAAPGTSSKPDTSKPDLVWIPCEPEFARKMGWPVDPSMQHGTQSPSSQSQRSHIPM
ncbi:transcription factor Sox-2-like [Haliotis rubra]|uniref:transcription factor Sox-2-like n=1 Tax=Haliotis rubra TaxID=36100 RepID=UPI001EE50407|nr:transcription factor Sox-2-like [Haliotis rubra]